MCHKLDSHETLKSIDPGNYNKKNLILQLLISFNVPMADYNRLSLNSKATVCLRRSSPAIVERDDHRRGVVCLAGDVRL